RGEISNPRYHESFYLPKRPPELAPFLAYRVTIKSAEKIVAFGWRRCSPATPTILAARYLLGLRGPSSIISTASLSGHRTFRLYEISCGRRSQVVRSSYWNRLRLIHREGLLGLQPATD